MDEKQRFRAQLREREQLLTEAARQESDARLRERFLALPEVAEAETVLLFCGMGREVDTLPLIAALVGQGKQVLLPRCLPGHRMEARRYTPGKLVRHKYGMLEPDTDCPVVDANSIDLILVPALCYDRTCCRMGRGGGFYDRYLEDYRGKTVGLCRDALLQDSVPRNEWDQSVELVLTETQLLRR